MKVCKICNNEFEANLDNFYKNNKNKDGLHSYCKQCTKNKSKKWMEDNEEKYKENLRNRFKRHFQREEVKERQRRQSKKQRESGYFKKWQNDNKDKIAEYVEKRTMNKKHEISDVEWNRCKLYFDNSCAYCGISEEKAKEEQGQYLHREHVDHNSANDISNCVPSCKSCNSKKWKYKLEDWYKENNDIYDVSRLKKIQKWLNDDYLCL